METPESKIIDPWNPLNKIIKKEEIEAILQRYGVRMPIGNLESYQRACVHKSYMARTIPAVTAAGESVILAERPENCLDMQPKDNNTYEFVGDSILGAIVADYLKKRYPQVDNEGWYTRIKTRIVNNDRLGKLVIDSGMQSHIIISRMVEESGGRENLRILGSMLEAWIDCIYEDFNRIENPIFDGFSSSMGFPAAQAFVINLLETHLDFPDIILRDNNYKEQLLKLYQARYKQPPRYKEVETEGPPHNRIFTMGVLDIEGNVIAQATARNKQEAEQKASQLALFALDSTDLAIS